MCSYRLRAGDIMHVPALRCVSLFFRLLSLLSVLTLALSQSTTLDLNTVALESSEPSVNNGMDQTITQASSVRAGSTSLSLSILQDSDLVTERKTGLALSDLIIPRASGSLESLPIARDEMSSNVDSWFSGDDGILTSPPIFQMMTAVTSLSDGISVNPSEVSNSFQTSVLSTVTQSTQDSVTAAFNMTPSFKSASDIATDTYVSMETSSVQSSPLFLENKTSHFGSSSFDINLISSVYEISVSQNQSVSDVSFSVKLNLSTSVSFDGMVTMETISPTFLPVPYSSESIDQHSADRSSVFVSMDTEVLSISSSGADIFTQSLPGTESSYQQQQSQSATLDIISTTSSGISDVSTITPTSTLTVPAVTSVLVENATSSSTPVPTPANNVTSTPTPATNVTSTPATNVTSTPATNVTSTPSSVTMSPTPDSECPSIQVNVTEEQYLVTELIIDSNEKITNCSMEAKMALVISAAFAKANTTTVETRKKRATEVAGVTVQMVSLNRTGNDVKLVYYVVRDGQVVDPTLVSQVMGYLHEMEVAILLGYVVKSVGKPYIQPVVYREDPKYWIIGVVLGGIVVLIGIIWCILFIYIKACRPSKKPNAENGTFDDTNDLEVKVDLDKNKPQLMKMTPSKQGVDIVRTEVGLAEQSRSRTQKLGSSSPPKNGHVISEKQPQTKRPINRHEKSPTKEKYRTEAYDSEASSNGTYHSERADDKQLLPPRNMKRPPGRGRSNSRGRKSAKSTDRPISAPRSRSRTKSPDFSDADISVRAGTFENVPKMSSSRDSPVKLRSTVHHVKLPPLVQQPLVAERPEDVQREKQEIDDTLQQKADIERWRNKQRQRSRKSARKKSRHPVGDSKEQRRAYMKAQEAINSVLDTDRPDDLRTHHSPKKSPKRRNGDVSLNSREPVPNWGNVESDSEIDKHSDRPEEALESARLRMHDLLDDAFALIAPLSSNGDVSSSQIPPGHTPMQVAVKPRDASGSIGWSPYSAADEAAVIHQQNQATMPPVGSVATPILGKLPNTNVPNENKGKYYATESPAPIVIRTSRIDPYTSVEMSSRLLNPAARSGHMTPPERDIISQPGTTNRRDYPTSLPDPLLRSQRMAISDPSVLQAGGPVEDGTDEQDVIYRSMKAGSSSEPLVKSLRQELERLSQRAGAHNAGHSSKGHESYPHV